METGYRNGHITISVGVLGRPLILMGDGNEKVVLEPASALIMLGRPLILMGDGNEFLSRPGGLERKVGTAVNPHGGWKLEIGNRGKEG